MDRNCFNYKENLKYLGLSWVYQWCINKHCTCSSFFRSFKMASVQNFTFFFELVWLTITFYLISFKFLDCDGLYDANEI